MQEHIDRIRERGFTIIECALPPASLARIRAELEPWLRQFENMPLAVPPAVARQYCTRVQEPLGYEVIEPGFMGYVDGRHPRALIDPDHRGRRHGAAAPRA